MEQRNRSNQSLLLLIIGGGLVLAAAAAFLAIPGAQVNVEAAKNAVVPVSVNFPAPVVRLIDLQNRAVAFSDYKGQVILYNAWATWCSPCKAEMPTLEAYYRAYQQDGLVVIAVEDGDPVSEVAAYVKKMGLSFLVWPDLKWVASEAFGINVLPTSYVIDRSGNARLRWTGAISRDMLEKYVTPLLKEP
jgi:cytochrome c biogenesis protein CcmG, thiol:disulfide interchange protein DsbE